MKNGGDSGGPHKCRSYLADSRYWAVVKLSSKCHEFDVKQKEGISGAQNRYPCQYVGAPPAAEKAAVFGPGAGFEMR